MATILIVEDEAPACRILAKVVERDGHQAVIADSVATFESTCGQLVPELAILDWLLTDGTAERVARSLRARCPQVPIIIATGFLPEVIRHELDDIEVSAIITKPLDLDQVRAAVTRALAS